MRNRLFVVRVPAKANKRFSEFVFQDHGGRRPVPYGPENASTATAIPAWLHHRAAAGSGLTVRYRQDDVLEAMS